MPPSKIKVGEVITAEFLNYLLGNATAFNTLQSGIEEQGTHLGQFSATNRVNFRVSSEVEIPAYSMFYLKEPPADTYTAGSIYLSAVQAGDETIGTKTYTNGPYYMAAGEFRKPYEVVDKSIYQLQVDPTNAPAVGELAGIKQGDWIIEAGGAQLLCLTSPDANNLAWFLGLPAAGSSELRVGFVIDNDIEARNIGEVELYDKDDVPNGTLVSVYNPHDVTFYAENTIPGEEAAADRVILFQVMGWPEPLIFPFMLSGCESIDPNFEPIDV